MPNMKEKLVELLVEFVEVDVWDNGEFIEKDIDFQKIASNLIDHGVTVQDWISVKDRLPSKEEYTAKAEDGTEYYVRLLIAYKTDIVEYEIGYYDGYKWMTEMPIRLVKDVVAWMPFPNLPQQPKGD